MSGVLPTAHVLDDGNDLIGSRWFDNLDDRYTLVIYSRSEKYILIGHWFFRGEPETSTRSYPVAHIRRWIRERDIVPWHM